MEDMKYYINFALIIAILAICSFDTKAQTPSASPKSPVAIFGADNNDQDDRYRIGFQDVLDIQVFRKPELNIRTHVNPNGMIFLYRLEKPIVAVCKTERELAVDIENAYRVSYLKDPKVNVVIAEQNSQPISVIGSVEKPGRYPVQKRMHLLEILALAGGPNKESGTRIMVARAGNSATCRTDGTKAADDDTIGLMNFKIRDVLEGRKTLLMEPGDIVSVLAADLVYVYGNVVEPGQIQVREPITLTQAIASSKGLKAATDKGVVRILRQKADSLERDDIPFNLVDIEKGLAKDPYLEPNDIVAVSKDGTKAFMNGFVKAFTNGLPTLIARGVAF